MNLPVDLEKFLLAKKQLSYDYDVCECGEIVLLGVEELKKEIIEVELEEKHYPSEQQFETGPWGHYKIGAVNLISSCERFFPDFILLWLPTENLYGTYDTDHSKLQVFTGTTWTSIVDNPLLYLNVQWHSDLNGISEPYDPRGSYKIYYEQ